MKLITKEIEATLPALYATDGDSEKKVIAKFFTPWADWTWYVFEGEKLENGDFEFFGYVDGNFSELGYFRLSELESVTGIGGLKVERDRHFKGVWVDNKIIVEVPRV